MDTSHNFGLVAASIIVAIVAGFTGLTLTKNLSEKTVAQRKFAIALAAVALGGGIWSMHFVAMLGLQLPILFYYDAAITLASALLAILIVGIALILLHFTPRRPATVVAAGALVGAGIVTMHYVGMSGLELCQAIYTVQGVSLAVLSALGLCIAAFWVAYGERNNRNILLGTLCFGLAVFAVHFVAMSGTNFIEVPGFTEFGPIMSNEVLAIGVILSSFVIFGGFLWASVTYLDPEVQTHADIAPQDQEDPPIAVVKPTRIPCEKNGAKIFIGTSEVAFIRADGHYTQVFTDQESHFCTWPITEASKRLRPAGFLKVHRSFLINPAKVVAFERKKDGGLCSFKIPGLTQVPVSRTNLKSVKGILGA